MRASYNYQQSLTVRPYSYTTFLSVIQSVNHPSLYPLIVLFWCLNEGQIIIFSFWSWENGKIKIREWKNKNDQMPLQNVQTKVNNTYYICSTLFLQFQMKNMNLQGKKKYSPYIKYICISNIKFPVEFLMHTVRYILVC